jgi:hypothetical protein
LDYLAFYHSKLSQISEDRWNALSKMRFFFGHQSVGQNILEGLTEMISHYPAIRLTIRETSRPGDFVNPIFAHALVGQNRNPFSKIRHFREILDGGVGPVADIAMVKFCYVDIGGGTDLDALMISIEETIASLAKRYPPLKVIIFTVPLTAKPIGLKPLIKRMLGRSATEEYDSLQRDIFNERLRSRFGNFVYDLAEVEAIRPDGTGAGFRKNAGVIKALNPILTDDGGHLNRLGMQVVAADLLLFMVNHAIC